MLTGLAGAVAQARDPDYAEALVRAIPDPDARVQALGSLAGTAAEAGDVDRAVRLPPRPKPRPARSPSRTTRRGRSTSSPRRPPGPATWTARRLWPAPSTAGRNGPPRSMIWPSRPRGATLAVRPGWPPTRRPPRAPCRTVLSGEYARGSGRRGRQAGDPGRPARLATEAEAIARTITDPGDQASVLRTLATAIAKASDLERAERLARAITDPEQQAWALAELAAAALEAAGADGADEAAGADGGRLAADGADEAAGADGRGWPRTRRLRPGPSPTPAIGPACGWLADVAARPATLTA